MPSGLTGGGALAAALALAALACETTIEPPTIVIDRTPPAVVGTLPIAGAEGVDTTATITVIFDEGMDPATVQPGVSFRVLAGAVPMPGTVVGDAAQKRFIYVPEGDLPGNSPVDVTIVDVADAAGNWLPAPYTFSFRTGGASPVPPRTPANPYPAAGAQGVPNDTTFTWTGGSDAGDPVVYDFWLGTSPASLTQRAADLTVTEYAPGPLPYATAHVWKVVARSAGGVTEGPLWDFTTEEAPPVNTPPPAPCTPYPPNQAMSVPDTTRLQWGCTTDPDGDTVTFEVHLGTTITPPRVATITASVYVPPAPLPAATRHYWRIVADDGRGGRTTGPLWTFVTATPPVNEPPSAPENPSPADDAQQVPVASVLTWMGGDDPDLDPVVYVVFLQRDNANDPDSVATVAEKSYSPPAALDPGAEYYWRIEARDARGARTSGPIWHFTTNSPPESPCNPNPEDGATGVGFIVRLDWGCGLDPDGGPVLYDVYFGTTPDLTIPIDTVSSRSYNVGGVLPATTYYWRIVARDQVGAETPGPVWSFTTIGGNTPPLAPCSPYPDDQATSVPDTTRLEWSCTTDPDGDTVTFEVYLGTTTSPPLVATTTEPVYLAPAPLAAGARHYWRIVADDGRGGRTSGSLWTFDTAAAPPVNQPPSTPESPSPAHDAIGVPAEASLAWMGGDDPDIDPVVYVVFLERDDAADPDSVATVTEKSYAPAAALDPGGEYYWRIEARDVHDARAAGPVWHFTGNLPPEAPCNPDPQDGETGAGSSVRLRWGCARDPEELPMLYDIYFGTAPDPAGPIATIDRRNYNLGGVQPATTYHWRIIARDAAGMEVAGPVWSFTTRELDGAIDPSEGPRGDRLASDNPSGGG